MFDIGKSEIEFECPKCGFKLKTTLKQVSEEAIIICGNCREDIKLQDSGYKARKGINDVNKSFKNLEKNLKKLGF